MRFTFTGGKSFTLLDEFDSSDTRIPCRVFARADGVLDPTADPEYNPQLEFDIIYSLHNNVGRATHRIFYVQEVIVGMREHKIRLVSQMDKSDIFECDIDAIYDFEDETEKHNFVHPLGAGDIFLHIKFCSEPTNLFLVGNPEKYGMPEILHGTFRFPREALEWFIKCFPNHLAVRRHILRKAM